MNDYLQDKVTWCWPCRKVTIARDHNICSSCGRPAPRLDKESALAVIQTLERQRINETEDTDWQDLNLCPTCHRPGRIPQRFFAPPPRSSRSFLRAHVQNIQPDVIDGRLVEGRMKVHHGQLARVLACQCFREERSW